MTSCAVVQFDPETGESIAVYPSVHQAARIMNCSPNIISMVLLGKQQTAAGYLWERLDPQPPCSELCYEVLEYLSTATEPITKKEIRFMFTLSKGSEQNAVDTLLGLGFIASGYQGAVTITETGAKALAEKPY